MNSNLRQPFLLGQAPRSFGKYQARFGDEEGKTKTLLDEVKAERVGSMVGMREA